MKDVNLYAYGRSIVEGAWQIDTGCIVDRLYYVNSGAAEIWNGTAPHRLTAGKIYLIPQCKNFRPLDAWGFDHTFFDFYYARLFRRDSIVEIDAAALAAEGLFAYINALLAADDGRSAHEALEELLSGFLSSLACRKIPLPYLTNAAVTQAVKLIHENCVITTGELAKRLNLDESYFIRLFSSAMGITPMKYIRAYRVACGREYIRNGAGVAWAAEKCGYASPSSFYNAVKAELHVSPSVWKRGL